VSIGNIPFYYWVLHRLKRANTLHGQRRDERQIKGSTRGWLEEKESKGAGAARSEKLNHTKTPKHRPGTYLKALVSIQLPERLASTHAPSTN
jgi:hypothetical protein